MVGEDENHGTIVITENQTNGKGQKNKTWGMVPGKSLVFSLILTKNYPIDHSGLICLSVSLALKESLNKRGLDAKLKWPNDLFVKGKKIPIFIANFVLKEYGLGAIFGCPAHDQRDLDFAREYDLDVIPVVKPSNIKGDIIKIEKEAFINDGTMINSYFLDGLEVEKAKEKIIKEIEDKKIGQRKTNYKLRDWGISRQRFWGCPIPIIYREDGKVLTVEKEDLPITLPEDIDFSLGGNPLENHPTWKYTTCKKTGMKAIRETDTLDTFFDSSWYFLKFIQPFVMHHYILSANSFYLLSLVLLLI
mgnify:CR=1 FL=1